MTAIAIPSSPTHSLATPPTLSVSVALLPQPSELSPVAARLGCDKRTVAAVHSGLTLSIRRQIAQQGEEVATVSLIDELTYCATNFSGARDVPDDMLDEAAEFVATRFGQLAVVEIREAFRLAAAGEIGDVDMKAYYGQFTIVILGAVLSAYVIYRTRITAGIKRAQSEAEAEAAAATRREQWDETEWATNRLQTLKQLAFDHALTMNDVAEIDYTTFERLGMYTPDEDKKRAAWERSDAAVRSEIATAAMSDISMRTMLQHLTTSFAKEFQDKRVGWCRRRLVVDWVQSLVAVEVDGMQFEAAAAAL